MFSIFQSEEDTVMADRIYGLNDIVDSVDQNGRKVIFLQWEKEVLTLIAWSSDQVNGDKLLEF